MASIVVATAGVLLFSSLAQITRSRQLAREQIILRQLLANRLAVLETVTDGEHTEGACDVPYETYHWTLSAVADPLPSLAQVTVSIASPAGHSMDAQTMRPLLSEH
jgi:hypothetical protein